MRKKITESDMPVGKLVRIKDFLPLPAELAKAEKTQKDNDCAKEVKH